jgi:hypothetical protein
MFSPAGFQLVCELTFYSQIAGTVKIDELVKAQPYEAIKMANNLSCSAPLDVR